MRATIETHDDSNNLPPIKVMVSLGDEDMSIKVGSKLQYSFLKKKKRVFFWLIQKLKEGLFGCCQIFTICTTHKKSFWCELCFCMFLLVQVCPRRFLP